jgi:alpha-amylase
MLHTRNICAIADIVINHRTAGHQDPRGHWNIFDGGVEDKRLAWGAWAVSLGCGLGSGIFVPF